MKTEKVMRKIISLLIAANMFFAGAVYAEESVDYSAQLAELEKLLAECERLGIPTDYERVNYSVIKRFESLINDDIANGHPAAEQNILYMDELCEETESNLTAYISGDKEAYKPLRPDMTNTDKNGSVVYSGSQPVFSVGYGHFGMARNDIDKFSDFGMTNMQIEIGPTYLKPDFYGWSEQIAGESDATGSRELVNGDYAMRIVNNTPYTSGSYLRYYKKIECKPGTKYKFGCFTKGENLDGIWISINNFSDRNFLTTSAYWKEHSFTYTTGSEQKELTFSICSEDITNGYLDDFYVYELDESDAPKSDNLVTNPGLEIDNCYSVSTDYVVKTLEAAEKNNIAVCLLISPHYFPTNLDEEVYTDKSGFIKFNINHPDAKEVIENYIRALMPTVQGYDSLDSICISNEPTFSTINFYDFYNPLFREYLKKKHGDIDTLNGKYNSDYDDFSDVNMPTDLTGHDAVCYDWIEFNDRTFTDWHKWMVSIIKEYLPDVPVHAKMMGYFANSKDDNARSKLTQGTDLEYFDEFSDYAGNDTWDFMSNINLYYNTMLLYDYQLSVTGKPVYNSEDHIIEDRSTDFSENQRKHLRNNLIMGAVHGRSMSTVWVWDKSTDTSSALYNSIAYRPDVAAEAGRKSLDLMRFNDEIARLQQEKPKTAVLYSKTSRLYDESYMEKLLWTYISLVNMGEKVGVVSDNSIDLLSGYGVLVIPGASNCTAETLETVKKFAQSGRKVIYTGDALSADEYNNPIDNSFVSEFGYLYNSYNADAVDKSLYSAMRECGRAQLYFIDADTGERAEKLDWQYSAGKNNILLTVTNLEYDSTKNLVLYMNDEPVSNIKDCFTGEQGIETVSVEGYTPRLMSIRIPKQLTLEIDNISVDRENSIIKWNYRTDKYFGANIYSVLNDGTLSFKGTVRANQYSCTSPGTYLVTALGEDMFESKGRMITVTENAPLQVSCASYKISGDSISAVVQVSNKEEKLNTGVTCVIAKDSAGNTVGSAYMKLNLFPGKTDSFNVTVPTVKKASEIEIYAVDSVISQNLCSGKMIVE